MEFIVDFGPRQAAVPWDGMAEGEGDSDDEWEDDSDGEWEDDSDDDGGGGGGGGASWPTGRERGKL